VHVNAALTQALSLLQEQLRIRDIQIVLELDSVDPVISGNAIQLEQVFLNLLTNARDALNKADRKLIHISSRVEGPAVAILVRDSGPGIPPGLENRIFDPFFTTKEVGEGTGLGLSITYGIVRDHDGAIRVENAPDRGAAFVIEFPLLELAQRGAKP
jgi:C4-dicarboxylate-specific signal transduction histidine kinase